MSGHIYRLHSTLGLPLEDVMDYFENDPELPPEVENVDITRRNNTLIIKAVSAGDNLSKYTSAAQLKASVTENHVYGEEPPRTGAPSWGDEGGEEIPSELVELACFKGDLETMFQNTVLQYPMSLILREIAMLSEKGTLTAITEESNGLRTTHIVEGKMRTAPVEVVENPQQNGPSDSGINWRDNKFIS